MNQVSQKHTATLRLPRWPGDLLLVGCCAIIAARCQINESLHVDWRISGPAPIDQYIAIGSPVTMLVMGGLVTLLAAIWLIGQVLRGPVRITGTVLPILLFIMTTAAIVSVSSASNKHIAIIGAVTLLCHIVMAIMLVQLSDDGRRRMLLLCVLVGCGLVTAYRCWEQYRYDIPQTINLFEQNRELMLQRQGIAPDSYAAHQYEGRLRSADIGGFFAISNTTGAFLILTSISTLAIFLCVAGRPIWTIAIAAIFAGQTAILLITKSKGAIGAYAAGLLMLAVLWPARRFLRRHWRVALAGFAIAAALAVAMMISYGVRHGRLPSNSGWVRWQYWTASAEMIAENWFSGVGPENFGQHYPRHLDPAAPEVVKDPHSLPVAIWSQWGLLGLAGLLWSIVAITIRLARPADKTVTLNLEYRPYSTGRWLFFGILTAASSVIARIATSEMVDVDETARLSVYLLAFIVPAVVFSAGFAIAAAAANRIAIERHRSVVLIVMACGLAAFFLHSLIDFAIFQPGVGAAFFAIIALLLAIKQDTSPARNLEFGKRPATRLIIAAVAIAGTVAFWLVLVRPAHCANRLLTDAQNLAFLADQNYRNRWLERAIPLAAEAAEVNRFDPAGPYMQGRLQFLLWQTAESELPAGAIKSIERAAERNPADFRYYDQLAGIYHSAAEKWPGRRDEYNEKALVCYRMALDRYPSKGELLIDYGRLLCDMGRRSEGLAQFDLALASESAYTDQQRRMYPDRPTVAPRLDPDLVEQLQSNR